MPRVDADVFDGRETSLVYIASTLREAERVEALLTQQGIDYAVALAPFVRAGIFAALWGSQECAGVGFTVASDAAARARDLLHEQGLRTGIIDEEWSSAD